MEAIKNHEQIDVEVSPQARIVELIARRLEVSQLIGLIKNTLGATIYNHARELEVISGFADKATGNGLDRSSAIEIIVPIVTESRSIQYKKTEDRLPDGVDLDLLFNDCRAEIDQIDAELAKLSAESLAEHDPAKVIDQQGEIIALSADHGLRARFATNLAFLLSRI